MNIKYFLTFISGFVIGGAAGIIGTKKYFEDNHQKTHQNDPSDLEEYRGVVDKYARISHDESDLDSNPGGRMSSEERDEIKKKLNEKWGVPTNYTKMYQINNVGESESKQIDADGPVHKCENCDYYDHDGSRCINDDEIVSPNDSCSDFTPYKETENKPFDEEVFDKHQKNKYKPPKIISIKAYEDLPSSIDKAVLLFYAYDETLTDEDNNIIDEPERLLGDSLVKYNFIASDEDVIFVLNYALDICYEIQKVEGSYDY